MCSFSIIVAPNNHVGDLSLGLSITLDSYIVNLDHAEIFNVELWSLPIDFTGNMKGKFINASLFLLCPQRCSVSSDRCYNVSAVCSVLFLPQPVKCAGKYQKALLSHNLLLIPRCGANGPHRHAASSFPEIAGHQAGKKNDQRVLLTPLRSGSYTQGCGYYLSSSKSACLVIISAWDRNLS